MVFIQSTVRGAHILHTHIQFLSFSVLLFLLCRHKIEINQRNEKLQQQRKERKKNNTKIKWTRNTISLWLLQTKLLLLFHVVVIITINAFYIAALQWLKFWIARRWWTVIIKIVDDERFVIILDYWNLIYYK